MIATREFPPDFGGTRLAAWGSLVLCAVFAWAVRDESWLSIAFITTGIYLPLSVERRVWQIKRDQKTLDVRERSFVLQRGAESREYLDADVTAIAYARFNTYKNGLVSGNLRRFRIWMEGGKHPILLEHYFASIDPLNDFIERLIHQAVVKADANLKAGGEIEGESWRLQGATFFPLRGMPLPLSELTGVGIYDGRVRIWGMDKTGAKVDVPVDSRNAIILLRLLQSRMPSKANETGLEDATGLGPVLFERRHGYLVPYFLLGIGALLLVGGIFSPDLIAFGVVAGIFLVVGTVMLKVFARTFRCHQRGVFVRGLLLRRLLRYEDVASFTYEAVRHYQNFVYQGTRLTLGFEPAANTGRKNVWFETWLQGKDDDLDELRDFVAGIIARQIEDRLNAEGNARWTKRLSFLTNGLQFMRPRLLGQSESVMIPYSTCDRLEFKDGTLTVFPPFDDRPLFTLKTGDDNFFPGYFVLLRLTGKTAGAVEHA